MICVLNVQSMIGRRLLTKIGVLASQIGIESYTRLMSESVTPASIARAPKADLSATTAALTHADEAARGYANRSRASSTWRAYESDWRTFLDWCDGAGVTPLPASPRDVARFLAVEALPTAERPNGRATSTLRGRLAAIRLMHLGAGLVSPHAAPEVTEVLRGIANARRDVPSGRKRPALDADICRMVDALDIATLAGLRDRAVLLLGFAGALRRSEIVALDVADLERRDEGLLVTVRHSKTDQAGSGQTVAVPAQADSPYCPVEAVEHWTLAAGVRAGAVFRRFFRGDVPSPHRLSAQSVAAIVKRGATAIGRDPAELSGHSLRHGFLTQAARNGSDVFRMAAQSRHRDVRTVMTYVQDETRFDDHPGQGMLRAREPVEARDDDDVSELPTPT